MELLKTPLGMIISAIVILAAGFAIGKNWDTWFPSTDQEPVLDANGNATGRYVAKNTSSTARQAACCSTNGGFIGNCRFPIKPTDNVPACSGN